MAPNIYANVTLLQPFAQTANDRPIRMHGTIPIVVENPTTYLEPVLEMPEQLRPEEQFTLRVQENRGRAMTYTIAMVDEGLLDLTRFGTPNPHGAFYARQALNVLTFDNYDLVMGAQVGRVGTPLAIGGDGSAETMKGRKHNRFPPVVRFLGPFQLEAGATDEHKIEMPRYVGSVRTMVVAGAGDAFGSTSRTTPVKQPMMILGTMPRVMGPGETVNFPISIFAGDGIKQVTLKLKTDGLLQAEGPATQKVTFAEPGEKMVDFPLRSEMKQGLTTLRVEAESGGERATYEVTLRVRNPNPYMTNSEHLVIDAGDEATISYETLGMEGTNSGMAEISAVPPIDLSRRLDYLIQYPHGCLEQTTSSVFPQLYLGKILNLEKERQEDIDINIKEGIKRLARFQTYSGGLAYWPGGSQAHPWSTNYAGHFLLEAERLGYVLPSNFKARLLAYLKQQANANNRGSQQALEQAYRLLLLAQAGEPELGAMNRFRESKPDTISRWMLAASYYLAGQREIGLDMITHLKTTVSNYRELSGTFGSGLRDRGMILYCLQLMERHERAAEQAQLVAEELNSGAWFNTQALGMSLMATGRLISHNTKALQASIKTGKGNWVSLDGQRPMVSKPLPVHEKKGVYRVRNQSQQPLYVRTWMRGKPVNASEESRAQKLKIKLEFKDFDGVALDPSRIKQGTDFFAEVTVIHPGGPRYDEMALTQVFPSGWEIINDRLAERPANLPKAEYEDFRDDRVMRYFDLSSSKRITFRTTLNAGYKGRYYLPATVAEAMYDNTINASVKGQWVEVVP